MKTMIEFFSGSGQMSKAFKLAGYETLSIDNNPDLNPDMVMDILSIKPLDLPEKFRNADVIWFSPPCTTFSVCTISRHFKNGLPWSSQCFIGLSLAIKCLELIEQLKPKIWFIENPRGMLRKQHFMPNHLRKTVTYCQYGDKNQKPTDIWTNAVWWIPKKMCHAGDSCHDYQPGSYKNKIKHRVPGLGIQGLANAFERAKIPELLCTEITYLCDYGLSINALNNKPNYSLNLQMTLSEVLNNDR